MKIEVCIFDQEPVSGYVFRVAEMTNGACTRSLACRVERCAKGGYEISFYGPSAFGMEDAKAKRKPLQAIPLEYADLFARAMQHAELLTKEDDDE